MFSHPESRWTISNLTIMPGAVLFTYSEVPFIQEVSGLCTPPCFYININLNWLCGPTKCQRFRKTAHRDFQAAVNDIEWFSIKCGSYFGFGFTTV